MNPKFKKIVFLLIGLTLFAGLGTYAIYSIEGRPSRPVLSSKYKFFKGLSEEKLQLSNGEIITLNRSFWENRNILKKAVLTVVEQEAGRKQINVTPQMELKFSLQLQSKKGISYSPQNIQCLRGSLVHEISRYVDEGARILSSYETQPELKNRAVRIIDM